MGRGFEETSYRNYIGNKKYNDNFDAIDWGNNGKDTKKETDESVGSNTNKTEKQDVRNGEEETRNTSGETDEGLSGTES